MWRDGAFWVPPDRLGNKNFLTFFFVAVDFCLVRTGQHVRTNGLGALRANETRKWILTSLHNDVAYK